MIPLPVDAYVDEIADRVRRSRAAIVTAAPGAGKTTRVPPALAADGPLILLQPRRVAARAIAARIAEERGWTIGREVGWQVRFDRRFTAETRLLVVTEGILTARLQEDQRAVGGQRRRHARSLAGAGRGGDDGRARPADAIDDLVNEGVDGKRDQPRRLHRRADADRAAHAGATQTAIAIRILAEVLLMIVLGVIELGRGLDLRRDWREALFLQGRIKSFFR